MFRINAEQKHFIIITIFHPLNKGKEQEKRSKDTIRNTDTIRKKSIDTIRQIQIEIEIEIQIEQKDNKDNRQRQRIKIEIEIEIEIENKDKELSNRR